MPRLEVYSNSDAEIFVMDAALTRIGRAVGRFSGDLENGLYKIKVNRAGALRERVIELKDAPQTVSIYVERFSAIAPIGPMLADQGAVEAVGLAARNMVPGPAIFVLGHQPLAASDSNRPFHGARIFPWEGTRHAIALDDRQPSVRVINDELWAAVAIEADPKDGPFVLELRRDAQVSRQAILVAKDWETRIFLRGGKNGTQAPDARESLSAGSEPFDVSIQMALHGSNIVYDDHWQTVEVARSALELGRAIFTSTELLMNLLDEKYDNPVTGLTGLHLFLDAKARWEAGDPSYDLGTVNGHDPQAVADEVLVNLTRLLHPERAKDAQSRLDSEATRKELLYPDPKWPEAPDLTALRIRAGRVKSQVFVPAAPMFRASWDILKLNASRNGLTWIGRNLWRSTGDAGSIGPYVAWAPSRHSVKRTLSMIDAQYNVIPRAVSVTSQPGPLERTHLANVASTGKTEISLQGGFADVFGIPLSILQGDRSKNLKNT